MFIIVAFRNNVKDEKATAVSGGWWEVRLSILYCTFMILVLNMEPYSTNYSNSRASGKQLVTER
jgi:hypothetical protein